MGRSEESRAFSVECRAEWQVLNTHKEHTNNWASEQDTKDGGGSIGDKNYGFYKFF